MFSRFSFLHALALCAAIFLGAASTTTAQVFRLQKLLIADTDAKVAAMPADKGGDSRVVVEDVPLLAGRDFPQVIAPFFGQPINAETVNQLVAVIRQYAIKNDRLVEFALPTQDISSGTFRLAVSLTRYVDLPEIKGNRWFSSKLLREKLGIKPGDEVSIARLDEAVNWANTNPFRHIQVAFTDNQPGRLYVAVEERIPLRLVASYDDSGNDLLGNRHYTGALIFGNVLGLDHQLTYQFSTTDHQRLFRAHSLGYQIPLPWRHRLDLSANYLTVRPDVFNGNATQIGKNIGASIRYTLPLRNGPDGSSEVYAAFDFKQSNNNLAYGGNLLGGSPTQIFQLSTGYSKVHRDKLGAWLLGAGLNFSPGYINKHNSTDIFRGIARDGSFRFGRVGANAHYAYGNLSLQRIQNLDRGWQLHSRGTLQLASTNLLGSEQISIGGSATIRGFDERIVTGDMGAVLSNDLLAPVFNVPLTFLNRAKKLPPLETRFLAFYDIGRVRNTHRTSADRTDYDANYIPAVRELLRTNPFATIPLPPNPPPLASAGFGVRMNIATNFSVTADYGWQLTRLGPGVSGSRNRAHVKVVLAY